MIMLNEILLDTMKQMNFDNNWIVWIRRRISFCSFPVLVEGEAKCFFRSHRAS